MGTRKRHHIVPRFLLARFASSSRDDKSFVWRVAEGPRAVEISTKDAAVQSHFYGREEEGLEAALGDAEGRWGALLRRIDAGTPLDPLASELWSLLYLIAFRASPIRSAFTILAEQFLYHLSDNACGSEVREGLRRNYDRAFDEELETVIARLPPQFHRLIRANKHLLYERAKKELEDMDIEAMMHGLLGVVTTQDILSKAAKSGHNKGIAKLLDQGHAPKATQPVAWQFLRDEAGSVVLGDSPVVAVGSAGNEIGAPWKFGRDCKTFYLPLSPRLVLVGIRDMSVPLLSISDFNSASASLSEAAFFSTSFGDDERALSNAIGSRWMPLSEEEIQAIMQETLRDFGNPKKSERTE